MEKVAQYIARSPSRPAKKTLAGSLLAKRPCSQEGAAATGLTAHLRNGRWCAWRVWVDGSIGAHAGREPRSDPECGPIAAVRRKRPSIIGGAPSAEHHRPSTIGQAPSAEHHLPSIIGQASSAGHRRPAQLAGHHRSRNIAVLRFTDPEHEYAPIPLPPAAGTCAQLPARRQRIARRRSTLAAAAN